MGGGFRKVGGRHWWNLNKFVNKIVNCFLKTSSKQPTGMCHQNLSFPSRIALKGKLAILSFSLSRWCLWFGEGGGRGGLELSSSPSFHTLSLDTLARPGLTRTENLFKIGRSGLGWGAIRMGKGKSSREAGG